MITLLIGPDRSLADRRTPIFFGQRTEEDVVIVRRYEAMELIAKASSHDPTAVSDISSRRRGAMRVSRNTLRGQSRSACSARACVSARRRRAKGRHPAYPMGCFSRRRPERQVDHLLHGGGRASHPRPASKTTMLEPSNKTDFSGNIPGGARAGIFQHL
jgi:hypothetical protein